MTASLVGTPVAFAQTTAASTFNVTIPATSAGSALVVAFGAGDASVFLDATTPFAGGSGTWTKIDDLNDAAYGSAVYIGTGITAGTTSITVKLASSDNHVCIESQEWAGLDVSPVVGHGTVKSASTASTSWTSNAYTSTNATSVLIGFVMGWPNPFSATVTTTVTGSWTATAEDESAGANLIRAGYQIVSSTASFTFSGTANHAIEYHAHVVELKQAASATSFTSAAGALGALTATAPMLGNLTSAAAPLGALSASASALRGSVGASGAVGALTATAALSAVPANNFTSAAAPLGALSATAALSLLVAHPFTSAAAALGAISATAALSPRLGLPMLIADDTWLIVEAAFGADVSDLTVDPDDWDWTDVSKEVRQADGITIVAGRPDETSQAPASQVSATTDNDGTLWSPKHPGSPRWPDIRPGLPMRVRVDPGTGPVMLGGGYLAADTPTWDRSGHNATAKLVVAGLLRRLGRLKAVSKSPVDATISRTSPAASWPMDDGATSTSFASAVPGVRPLTISGAVVVGAGGNDGAAASGDFSGGGYASVAVNIAIATSFRVHLLVNTTSTSQDPSLLLPNNAILQIGVVGAVGQYIELALNTAGLCVSMIKEGSATVSSNRAMPAAVIGPWYSILADFHATVGGDTGVNMWINGVAVGGPTFSLALNRVTLFRVGGPSLVATTDGDHAFQATALAVWVPWTTTLDVQGAALGYPSELVTDRLARLSLERGVRLTVVGTSDVLMGPQGVVAWLDSVRACEAADGGVLNDGLTLTYTCRSSRYNLAAALTLDAAAKQIAVPYSPTDDDQRIRNYVSVSRVNGGTAIAYKDGGPAGRDTVDEYDYDAGTLLLADDSRLDDIANWQLSLGLATGYDLRLPQLSVDLQHDPDLIPALLAAGQLGFRTDVLNLGSIIAEAPPDDSVTIVEGITHTISPSSWKAVANTSPGLPWQVAVVGSTWRVDSGSSSLHTGVDATHTTLLIDCATLWVTDAVYPADFPFDASLDGERVTVTGISGGSSPQTATVIRSVNSVVRAHSAGAPFALFRPPPIAM